MINSRVYIVRVSLVCIWFILAVVSWKMSSAEETPSFVVRCKSSNDDESCYKRQGQSLASSLISGYPKLKLETLDPFVVKILDLTTGGLKLVCKDVTFTGFSNAIVDKFIIDISAKKLTMNVRVDTLDGTGEYKAGGRILVLPIEGEGKSDVAIKNMKLNMMYPFEIVDKIGKQYINLKSVSYTWDIVGNVRFHFENLFNGNKALSEVTHRFMNENWKDVSDELAPPIIKILFTKLTGNLKKIFATVPLDEFLQV